VTLDAALPFAGRTLIALEPGHYDCIRKTVATIFRLTHGAAWQARVDAGAPPHLRFAPGNFGVFMGYDFHVTPAGPRLIEINTNAGGALVNGLHTASLCDPVKLACLCADLQPVERMEERLVAQFGAEFEAARGAGMRPRSIAIADEKPHEQFLHPEFEMMAEMFERRGIAAHICETGDLAAAEGGGLALRGEPIDLVYLRDTDFTLETERAAALRAAYLAGEVVVTPAPREYHLLGDKRRLALLSSPDALEELGASAAERALLAEVVPETLGSALLAAVCPACGPAPSPTVIHEPSPGPAATSAVDDDAAWAERRHWVFKPATAYGSRAVYRGDKISRKRFDEILAVPGYLAQRRVEPGAVAVETSEGPRTMKFDVRAYAYRDEVLLLGARVYQGQVTNLRSPGGGFSAICVFAGEGPAGG